MRFFSTAGPVRPGEHYLIPPLSRIDMEDVLGLVPDQDRARRRGEGPSTVDVWGM